MSTDGCKSAGLEIEVNVATGGTLRTNYIYCFYINNPGIVIDAAISYFLCADYLYSDVFINGNRLLKVLELS